MSRYYRINKNNLISGIVAILIIAAITVGILFATGVLPAGESSNAIEWKASYISGDFYARNNIDNGKTTVEVTESDYGLSVTMKFTPQSKAGYEVDTIKCNIDDAVITSSSGEVTVVINGEYDKDDLSIMVIYKKLEA